MALPNGAIDLVDEVCRPSGGLIDLLLSSRGLRPWLLNVAPLGLGIAFDRG
jgi:hypothetical protein